MSHKICNTYANRANAKNPLFCRTIFQMNKPNFSHKIRIFPPHFSMKSILTIISVYLCITASYGQFIENFDDGDFAGWSGMDTDYVVNASTQLQLNGDCASGGTAYLTYPAATLDAAMWTFFVDLDFDPSSANHARVFLQSNSPNLLGDVYGYFVRIGEDGTSDKVELWRNNGATASVVIEGIADMSISPTAGVKVVRTAAAEWQLFVDPTGGTDYVLEGTATDNTYNGGNYFGVWSRYSSTRCDKFYYDNITIDPIYVDNSAPEVLILDVISTSQIEITFNETVELTSAQTTSNYAVDGGIGNPIDASRGVADFSKVLLTFLTDFPEGVTLTLTINGVADMAGNVTSGLETEFAIYTTQLYDVVINEIFADIEPQLALPLGEYVELYNNSILDIDLTNFKMADASSESDGFPTYVLPAGGYVILVDDGVLDLFTAYTNVIGVTSFPSLNNDGDDLKLISPEGNIIHTAFYTLDWYNNAVKEDGGWSLEMIDPNNPCQEGQNWTASTNTNGGTPGVINAVNASNPDETPPALTDVYPLSIDTLIVSFDEKIKLENVLITDFNIVSNIGELITPIALILDDANPFIIGLVLSAPLTTGTIYTLTVNNISDCSGNEINLFNSAPFGLPEPALANDVVINEVLFNAVTDGFDYVEIYNRSAKIIDLSTLIIAEMDLFDTLNVIEYGAVSASGRLLFPGSYLCMSANSLQVTEQYFAIDTGNFIDVNDMPSYTDNEGIVALLDQTLNEIDRLHFFDDWQYAILSDDDGVALERVNFDFKTQDENNWNSAAADVHFGTPGYQNSVFGAITNNGSIGVEYTTFSPDGDGFNDLLVVTYATPAEGYTGSFQIFNAQGKLVKQLSNNTTLSREGFLTWDGLNEDNEKSASGIYIVYAALFDLNGNTSKYKIKCTLVRKQ